MRRPRSLGMPNLSPESVRPRKTLPWRWKARRDSHWFRAIFSTRICSVWVAGWCSLMRSVTRALNFLGFLPGMMVAWEAKPWDRRLREDAAFPSGVFGPRIFVNFLYLLLFDWVLP